MHKRPKFSIRRNFDCGTNGHLGYFIVSKGILVSLEKSKINLVIWVRLRVSCVFDDPKGISTILVKFRVHKVVLVVLGVFL